MAKSKDPQINVLAIGVEIHQAKRDGACLELVEHARIRLDEANSWAQNVPNHKEALDDIGDYIKSLSETLVILSEAHRIRKQK